VENTSEFIYSSTTVDEIIGAAIANANMFYDVVCGEVLKDIENRE
jgi:hypothetical protein